MAKFGQLGIAPALAILSGACAAMPVSSAEETQMSAPHQPAGVAGLPYARGHVFATLDAYLAYLAETNGPVDLPWWREIAPDVYRYEVRIHAGDLAPETATRAELAERFGFAASD